MSQPGLKGVVRGRTPKTTLTNLADASPAARVNRHFQAARLNAPWLSALTDVATWRGFVYVAFVSDADARRFVGWRVSSSLQTDLALDAPRQALYDRPLERQGGLVHHRDRGARYLSIRYAGRLADAGIEPSVGTVGDSCGNALAGTIIGLDQTGVIRQRRPWRNLAAVELATPEWVDWFNHRRLLEPLGDVPPSGDRTSLRSSTHRVGPRGLTQSKWPPECPVRFKSARVAFRRTGPARAGSAWPNRGIHSLTRRTDGKSSAPDRFRGNARSSRASLRFLCEERCRFFFKEIPLLLGSRQRSLEGCDRLLPGIAMTGKDLEAMGLPPAAPAAKHRGVNLEVPGNLSLRGIRL